MLGRRIDLADMISIKVGGLMSPCCERRIV